MQHVHVETDAQILIKAINSKDFDLAPNGAMFGEIRATAYLNFISFSVSYCPRASNKVADALASYGAKMVSVCLPSPNVWLPAISRRNLVNGMLSISKKKKVLHIE